MTEFLQESVVVKEDWTVIPGHKDSHEVSNQGRIRSLNYTVWRDYSGRSIKQSFKGRIKKLTFRNGYMVVNIGGIPFPVHRLVWLSFNGPIDKGLEVNHKNGDSIDNRLNNLELLTHTENIWHGRKTILNESIFERMLSLRNSGLSLPTIAKNLNVSLATIDKWMHGRTQLAKQLWGRRK